MGSLTTAELLSLVDEMLDRGVVRFELATGAVEFSPKVIEANESRKASQRAEEAHRRALAEAGTLEAYEAQRAREALEADKRLALGSA